MTTKSEYFEFSDAWLFASLTMYDSDFKKIDLTNIIAYGDALNHSIFSLDELRSGFKKLVKFGLITIQNDSIKMTELGLEIIKKVTEDKGGLFQQIDNTLKWIIKTVKKNSNLSQNPEFVFLNEAEFEKAYKNYKN